MSEEIEQLVTKLEKLRIQRSKAVTELATINNEITTTLKASIVKKCTATIPPIEARNSAGILLLKGDIVETITTRKYHEIKAKVLSICGDTFTIQYLRSKKETWRKERNLFEVSN